MFEHGMTISYVTFCGLDIIMPGSLKLSPFDLKLLLCVTTCCTQPVQQM